MLPSLELALENPKIAMMSLFGANLAKVALLSIGKVSNSDPLRSRIFTSLFEVVTSIAPDGAVDTSRVSRTPWLVTLSVPFRDS